MSFSAFSGLFASSAAAHAAAPEEIPTKSPSCLAISLPAKNASSPVSYTHLSLNQDYLAFARLSVDRPLHVRFIEYMPVGESSGSHGCGWGKEDVVPSEELFEIINERARAEGMPELVPAGEGKPLGWGPARYFQFPGAQGTVGFISPLSRHFCGECNRLRLTADGKLRPCLFSDEEFDLRSALRADDEDAARTVFARALGAKPDEHHDKVGTERGMSQIGG